MLNGHVEHKNGCAYIKQYAIESILLPDLEQEIFFEERPYVFYCADNFLAKITRFALWLERCNVLP